MFLTDLKYILIWYLVTLLLSLSGFSYVRKILGNLPDKGYVFGRVLSLLFITYVSWMLSHLFKIPANSLTVWIYFLAITVTGILLSGARNIMEDFKKNYKSIVVEELLFIVFFSLMLLFRGATPNIEGIEKFMDYAIINGIGRGQTSPPLDVWYSGETINYYYFGHFTINTLIKLTGVIPAIAYNLSVASIFAFAGTCVFSLNYFFTKNKLLSLWGALILVLGGNLDYFYNVFIRDRTDYFYAEARGLIPETINEFPGYSFLISDLHAHILNIPYVLLFIAVFVSIFTAERIRRKSLTVMVLVLGSLGVTNSWDLFIYGALLGLGVLLYPLLNTTAWGKWNLKKLAKSLLLILFLSASAVLLYLPFYLNFHPPVGGVGLVKDQYGLGPVLRMFGYFWILSLPFVVASFFKKFRRNFTKKDVLALLLVVFSLFLIFVPEFVFLKDIYFKNNPPFYRANTIFKIWYQSWIILSVVSVYAFSRVFKLFWEMRTKVFRVFSVIFMAAALFFTYWIFSYTVTSVKYIVGPNYTYKGLDGSAFLTKESPGDKAVIDWINNNVSGQPVLLEVYGSAYTRDSLISSYTGLPTIVGWTDHEFGWRDDWPDTSARMGEIERLYLGNSAEEVQSLLKKYNIKYVVISGREKAKFGETAGMLLRSFSDTITSADGVELLEIPSRHFP